MRKRSVLSSTGTFLVSLLFLALSALAWGDDRFAVAIGPKDTLVILGSQGETAASFSVPTISQPVTVNGVSFLVSFGRNANDLLTAILSPNATAPQDLHFSIMKKSVDVEQGAVVTLTFSARLNHVTIDPGYIGLVHVDMHLLPRHSLNDGN